MPPRPRTLQERISQCFATEKSQNLLIEATFQIGKKLRLPISPDLTDLSPTMDEYSAAKRKILSILQDFQEGIAIINRASKSDDLLFQTDILALRNFPKCLRTLADSLAEDRDNFRKLVRVIKKTGPETVEGKMPAELPTLPEELTALGKILEIQDAMWHMRKYGQEMVTKIGLQPYETTYYNSSQVAFTQVADSYQTLREGLLSLADRFETNVLGHFSKGK